MNNFFSIIIAVLILTSCDYRPDKLRPNEYLEWRSENIQEFIQSRDHKDFTITAEYMEPQFLALIELGKSAGTRDYSGIYNEYKCGLTFNISFKVKDPRVNLLRKDITSIEDYNHRIYILSYRMDEFITLEVNNEIMKPVLYNYEGYNELNQSINFRTVFVPEGTGCNDFDTLEKLQITVDDQLWGSGLTTFTFEGNAIGDFPEVIN